MNAWGPSVQAGLAEAGEALQRLRQVLESRGVQYTALPVPALPCGLGVGLLVGQDLITVSVGSPPDSHMANLTGGVLKNVAEDRLQVLDLCNRCTRGNAGFPVYLHDAQAGWDVLVQVRFLVDQLAEDGDMLIAYLQQLPGAAENARADFATAGIASERYQADAADFERLLLRSLA
jgi:hypothetical protein